MIRQCARPSLQHIRRGIASAVAALSVGAAVASAAPATGSAVAAPPPDAMPRITIATGSWSVNKPAYLPAGLVHVTLVTPPGALYGEADFGALKPGVSRKQVIDALTRGDEKTILALLTLLGGPSAAGHTAEATLMLPSGSDIAFMVTQDSKGKPHAHYTFLTVSAAASRHCCGA